jgi:uncharacterized protein DUF4833
MRTVLATAATLAVAAALCVPTDALGDAPARDVASVFHVSKSENRNEVHYGIHLDDHCAPTGAAPVFAYWRMLERGPRETEPLLSREAAAYGLLDQKVLARSAAGGRTVVRLRALSSKTIVIDSSVRDGVCVAVASTMIDGAHAVLARVHANVRWPFGVSSLVLTGTAVDGGRALSETLKP